MLRGSLSANALFHRRLDYLGTPNYIALFLCIGSCLLVLLKVHRLAEVQKAASLRHKEKREGTLDQIDGIELEEMLDHTMPRIDPETGEVLMGTGPEEKVTETEAMIRSMLRDIKEEEEEQKRKLMEDDNLPVIGPDGKPMLAHQAFDAFGNVLGEEMKEGQRGGCT